MNRIRFTSVWVFAIAALLSLAGPLEAAPPRYHLQDLGDLGGGDTSANAINASGQVVGYSTNAAGKTRAFLKSPGRSMVDLGTLGGDWSTAYGINDAGQVVGWALNELGQIRAFLKNPEEPMQDLGDLGGRRAMRVP